MAAVSTADGGGEAPDSLAAGAPVPPSARPRGGPLRPRERSRASSVVGFGRARHLWPIDLIEHEPVAGKNRGEARRIRIGVVAFREQDVEVIVLRGPPRPAGWAVPIRQLRRREEWPDRRRRSVFGVDAVAIIAAHMQDLLAEHGEGGRDQGGALDDRQTAAVP